MLCKGGTATFSETDFSCSDIATGIYSLERAYVPSDSTSQKSDETGICTKGRSVPNKSNGSRPKAVNLTQADAFRKGYIREFGIRKYL